MRTIFFFLSALTFTFICYGQSTNTAINHDKAYNVKPSPTVDEVKTEITFYNRNNTEFQKSITKLNSRRQILSEIRYDQEGNKTAMLVFNYDSLGHSTSRRFDKWMRYIGHTYEIAYYQYDQSGFLVSVINRNEKNEVYMKTFIINDEKGNAIELRTFDGYGNEHGKETTTYDYDNNSYTVSYWKNNGDLISSTTSKIDFENQDSDNTYNPQGDIVKSKNSEYEYKYDKYGNWVKMICYNITDGQKIKTAVHKREIKYSN